MRDASNLYKKKTKQIKEERHKKGNTIKEKSLSIKTRVHEKILICSFRRGKLANFYVIITFAEKLAC